MRSFDFNISYLALNSINIDDIGNCAIEGSNDDNLFYLFITRTTMGTTSVFTCGPFNPDLALLPTGFKTTYTRLEFSLPKLEKMIRSFLNDKDAKITNASVISFEDATNMFVDFKDYLVNYGKGVY